MNSIEKIQSPVAEEIKQFEVFFRNTMKSKVPLLDIILNYVLRRKGKLMRPMFVFLSAKLTGNICQSTFTAAALIELLHTATLIHDDVVDESYERRGFFSINALWKSKIAVLVGDFLLSKGLLTAIENNEFEFLRIVSEAVREMSEGELLQIEKSRKLNITEEDYFNIIRKKTAALIASCTACGAKSTNASSETIAKMKQIGEFTGIAFQIRDDLFDYQEKGLIGKPTGNDIKEKKMTLPLIHALTNNPEQKHHILRLVKSNKIERKKIDEIVRFVNDNKGIEYSETKMKEYHDKAVALLGEFPESDARNSMIQLVSYSISRNK